jgi:hypothetical protein
MMVLLLDTNIVSILFKPDHSYTRSARAWPPATVHLIHDSGGACAVAEAESLGTQAPRNYKSTWSCLQRCSPMSALAGIGPMSSPRAESAGRAMTTGDAWIAATAIRWDLPLVTADYRDFEHVRALTLVPVR